MSAEEVEGVIEWAAHHRLGQAVQSLLTYMQDVGYGVPQDDNVRNRLWLAGLDDGARDSVTCEEFRDMLDTVQNFKQLLLQSVTEKDYFHLLLRIKKQLLLAIIREQLQEKEIDETNIPSKVAKKLDLEEYWEVLNEFFPRSSTRLSLSANASAAGGGGGGSARKQKASAARTGGGGGTEEDSFKEYCETKQEIERRSLMNICEEGDTSVPCATKIAILLESATRESFVHYVADFSKKAEETLLGPPAALEFFPAGEDPALRVAQIRSKLVTMPRRDVVQSSRNQFKRQVADHLGPLLGKRGGAAAADDDDEEEEEVDDRRVRSRRGGAATAAAGGGGGGASARGGSAKEQRILEKRSENLQKSVRQRGGDPIDDFHHEDDDRMEEEEEEQEKARGSKRKTSSKSGTAKDRLRYNDLRRKGRSINFEDSQYRGDDEDEEEEEEDAAARKAKKGRKPSKSKGDEEEDEIEDSEDEDDDRRREHLRPPGKKQRYSLGTGLKKARARPEKRKTRVPWEDSEINCLKEAIKRFDLHGDWAKIRDLYKDHWKSDRTSVDIKDKWRNITTKVDKGQDNLDYKRVLKGLPK